nr:MAG: sodium/potassium-transporting ATPase subunit beta-like protein [Metapenaeopsis lamellata majanivirus]
MAKLTTLQKVSIGVFAGVLLALCIGLSVYFKTRPIEIRKFRVIPGDSLIQLKYGDWKTAQPYVDEIDTYLKRYFDAQKDENVIECSDEYRPKNKQICNFLPDRFSACHSLRNFGLNTSFPCIILALSLDKDTKIEPYQSLNEVPDDMPDDLKIEIEISEEDGKIPQVNIFL